MAKIFLDTNILVYAWDKADREKSKLSRKLLARLAKAKTGVLSTQVLQEFFVVATKKLGTDPLIAKNILHSFNNFEVVNVDVNIINEAIDCTVLHRLSFWDALIVAAAESANCSELWTEDLNNGQIIRGVQIVNPFLE